MGIRAESRVIYLQGGDIGKLIACKLEMNCMLNPLARKCFVSCILPSIIHILVLCSKLDHFSKTTLVYIGDSQEMYMNTMLITR